jgi:hypothetical protein
MFPWTLNIAVIGEKIKYPNFAEFDFIIDWRSPDKPTHFRLHKIIISYKGNDYIAWSYRKIYPEWYIYIHPQPDNVIEILAPKIENIKYGDKIEFKFV